MSLYTTMRTITLIIATVSVMCFNEIRSMRPQGPFGGPPPMQHPPMPGAGPQFGPPGGAPFGGPMQMPSEEEFEAMLKEIQKLEAENPGMLRELELAGHRAILEMPDAELQMFSQLVNMTPEALREEATKALTEAGAFGTPVLHELPSEEPQMPEKPTEKPEPTKPDQKKPAPNKTDIKNIQHLFDDFTRSLEALQQKSASVREVHTMVRNWLQELRELLFYTRILNHAEYYQDLASSEFQPLINNLNKLNNTIKSSLTSIVLPDDLSFETTPFDLLAVAPDATQAQIDAAYEKLEEKHSPKKLEETLRKEGVEEKSIQRQLKTAKLNFEIIQDAYDQLSDTKMREQLVRGVKAEKDRIKQRVKQAQQALNTIQDALEEAVYENDVLKKFEKFLAKYAPKQLALKKEMEEAEKKHLEEQKKRSSTMPPATPGRPFEPDFVYPPRHSYNDYGYYSDYSPYSPWYNDYNPYEPDFGYDEPEFNEREKPSKDEAGKEGEKKEDKEKKEEKDKGKDKDKEKKDDKKKPTKAEEESAQKIDPRSPEEMIKSLESNLVASTKAATSNNTQQVINNFVNYLSSKVKATKKPEQKPEQKQPEQKDGSKKPWEMTPEEREGWESLPGVKEPGETTEPQQPSEPLKENEEWVAAPINMSQNQRLLSLPANLKIDAILKDSENLLKKIERLHITPDEKLRDQWVKVLEAYDVNKKALAEVSKKLTDVKKQLPADKAQAHGATLDQIINSIADMNKSMDALSKKF